MIGKIVDWVKSLFRKSSEEPIDIRKIKKLQEKGIKFYKK